MSSDGAQKVETACKHLAERMTPLAEHIKRGFSPAIDVISIPRKDYQLLQKAGNAAVASGFSVYEDGTVTYRGIRLRPI